MSAKTERSPRQTRQLDFISQFTTNIKYIRGKDNVVADSLSRIGESEIAGAAKAQDLKVDLENIGKLQVTDEELENLLREEKTHKTSKFRLQNFKFPNMELYCEVSMGKNRPYIPKALRRNVFDSLHSISHPGIRTIRKLVCDRYFWPNMNKMINGLAKSCIPCQKSKIHRHTKSVHGRFDIPAGRFEHIHLDLVGPLPPSNGFSFILTAIDRFTRWPEAYPLKDMTAVSVAKAFVENVVSRFGTPK